MCKKRKVIQYKIAHCDDFEKLHHLHGIRDEKTDVCKLTYYNVIMRKLSYYFEMPINYFFYPIMVKRNDNNTILGKIQAYIQIEYYTPMKIYTLEDLHLCTFQTPTLSAEMSAKATLPCALQMRKGVKSTFGIPRTTDG